MSSEDFQTVANSIRVSLLFMTTVTIRPSLVNDGVINLSATPAVDQIDSHTFASSQMNGKMALCQKPVSRPGKQHRLGHYFYQGAESSGSLVKKLISILSKESNWTKRCIAQSHRDRGVKASENDFRESDCYSCSFWVLAYLETAVPGGTALPGPQLTYFFCGSLLRYPYLYRETGYLGLDKIYGVRIQGLWI